MADSNIEEELDFNFSADLKEEIKEAFNLFVGTKDA